MYYIRAHPPQLNNPCIFHYIRIKSELRKSVTLSEMSYQFSGKTYIHTVASLQSYALEQRISNRDIPQSDVIVEGAFFTDTVDIVQGVEPRPEDAAGAVDDVLLRGPDLYRGCPKRWTLGSGRDPARDSHNR